MAAIHVLNGPNLNRLGTREPEIYGTVSLERIEAACHAEAARHGCTLQFRQTDAEQEMIRWLHDAADHAAGLVINPAGFSYHSVGILDALRLCPCPRVEVHLSNIAARDEGWRSATLTAPAMDGVIAGLGWTGYVLAVRWAATTALRAAQS